MNNYGPKIITNGLWMMWDAASEKSFPRNGSSVLDMSKNNRNGILAGGISFATENNGEFVFDGINGRINTTFGMFEGVDSSSPFTISFFINPNEDQSETTNNPVWLGQAYYAGFGLRRGNNGTWSIWFRNKNSTYTDSLPIIDGIFQHIVLIWGGQQNPKIISYINGVLNSERNVSYGDFGITLTGREFRVGVPSTTGVSTGTGYFKGIIPLIHIYNRELTSGEILQNYNALKGRFEL